MLTYVNFFNNHYATINIVLHLREKKTLKRDFPFFIHTDLKKKTFENSALKQKLLSVLENDEYVVVRKQLPPQRSQV